MMTGDGYQQCYNGQLAVDEEFQLIVDNRLTNNASDQGELIGLLDGIQSHLGEVPEIVLADAGYRSETCFEELNERAIDGYVSVAREGTQPGMINGDDYPHTRAMAEKLSSADGQERYAQRKGLVEPVNGWIKQVIGFRRFSLRGLQRARGEWDLVCLATNLRRMWPLIVLE
jgi:hypothetical protein